MPGDKLNAGTELVHARSDAGDLERMPVAQVLAHFAVQPDRGLSGAKTTYRTARQLRSAVLVNRSMSAKLT